MTDTINVRFYFNNSSAQFNIAFEDLDLIPQREYWINKTLDILKKNSDLMSLYIDFKKTHKSYSDCKSDEEKEMFFNSNLIDTLSNNLHFYSKLLMELYTGFQNYIFLIKKDDNNFNAYISEYSYRENKRYFIFRKFYYNTDILHNKEIMNIASGNKEIIEKDGTPHLVSHSKITKDEIKLLESFNFDNISISISYLEKILSNTTNKEFYTNTMRSCLKSFHNMDISTNKKTNHGFSLYKLLGYSPKNELLHDKYSIFIKYDENDVELYYEPNFGFNDLCVVYFKNLDLFYSFNTSIGGFFYLALMFSRNSILAEDFNILKYNLLDKNNFDKLYCYIQENI